MFFARTVLILSLSLSVSVSHIVPHSGIQLVEALPAGVNQRLITNYSIFSSSIHLHSTVRVVDEHIELSAVLLVNASEERGNLKAMLSRTLFDFHTSSMLP